MKTFAGTFIAAFLFATFTANGATISRDHHSPFYNPGLVQYVAANGDFPAVIIANPFGAGSNATLLAVVELPGNFLPTALSSITAKARDDGHLVMIFNPRPSSSGDRACSEPTRKLVSPAAGSESNLRLQIAFCYDDEMVSEAYMVMPRPSGPGDQAFSLAMAQLLAVLLPLESPSRGDCGQSAGNC